MATTSTVVSKEVTLSHGTTRYLESGSGHPVILLHGAGVAGGADDFRPALAELGTGFRWLAPDFIGWPPGDTYPFMDAFPYLTDFVREFQDGLGLRSSHLVGCTMGGWIAGLFAYESPQRVDKLVMTGNPGFHGAANDRLAQFQIPPEDRVRQAVENVGATLSEAERDALVKQKVKKLNEPGFGDAFGNMMKTMSNGANRKRFNLLRRIPYLTMPTFFLLGRHDSTSEQASDLTKLVPGSKSHIIETGGHQIHYENAEEFSQQLVGFLA